MAAPAPVGGGPDGQGHGHSARRGAPPLGRRRAVAESSGESSGENQTGREYVRAWRETVARELDESSRRHEQTAVIQERILGRLDNHEQRLKSIEGGPGEWRGWLGTGGMLAGCAFTAIVAPILSVIGGIAVALIVYWLLHLPK